MMKEKIENEKIKIEKQEKIEEEKELKMKLSRKRKKEPKFIRLEQAQVEKDQAEKQRNCRTNRLEKGRTIP